MIIRELITKFGFEVEDQKLNDLDKSLATVKAGLKKAAIAAGALTGALGLMVRSTAKYADQVAKDSRAIGLSTDAYQELQHVAELTGSSIDQVTRSMLYIQQRAHAAAKGNKTYADTFKELGVNVKNANGELKDAEDLFTESIDSLRNMTNATEQMAIASKLFGRYMGREMVKMAKAGASVKEMREEAQKLGLVLGEDALQQAEDFQDAMYRVRAILRSLKHTIGLALMPVIMDVVVKFRNWWEINQDIVKQRLDTIVRGIAAAVSLLATHMREILIILAAIKGYHLLKALAAFGHALNIIVAAKLLPLIKALTGAKVAGVGLGVMFKGLLAAKLMPLLVGLGLLLKIVLPIIAAIGLLVLVVNDIVVYMKGGKSLLGNIISYLKESEGILGGIYAVLSALFRLAMRIISQFVRFIGEYLKLLIGALGLMYRAWDRTFGEILRNVYIPFFKELDRTIGKFLHDMAGWIDDPVAMFKGMLNRFWEDCEHFYSELKGGLDDALQTVIRWSKAAYKALIAPLKPIIKAFIWLWEKVKGGFSALADWLDRLTGGWVTVFFNAVTRILGFFSDLWKGVTGGFAGLSNWLNRWIEGVTAKFLEMVNRIGKFFSDMLERVVETFRGVGRILSGIPGMAMDLSGADQATGYSPIRDTGARRTDPVRVNDEDIAPYVTSSTNDIARSSTKERQAQAKAAAGPTNITVDLDVNVDASNAKDPQKVGREVGKAAESSIDNVFHRIARNYSVREG